MAIRACPSKSTSHNPSYAICCTECGPIDASNKEQLGPGSQSCEWVALHSVRKLDVSIRGWREIVVIANILFERLRSQSPLVLKCVLMKAWTHQRLHQDDTVFSVTSEWRNFSGPCGGHSRKTKWRMFSPTSNSINGYKPACLRRLLSCLLDRSAALY